MQFDLAVSNVDDGRRNVTKKLHAQLVKMPDLAAIQYNGRDCLVDEVPCIEARP
jgi:hypothetical protein